MLTKFQFQRLRDNNVYSSTYKFLIENSVIIAFVAVVILSSVMTDDFLTKSNILNILRQTSIIGIISLGMTLIIISGGIDLSVGSALVLVGALDILVINLTGSIILGILAAVAGGMLIGFVNGFIITKGKVAPFIVTLGIMATCRSLSQYSLHGGGISAKLTEYSTIANSDLFGISLPIFYFIIITAIVYVFSQKTSIGRYIYSIGSNERATLLSGINVDKIKIITYMIGGVLVSLSSIIETSRLNSVSSTSSGVNYELDAIAAVVIGGTSMSGGKGSIIGTFFGVLILGILNNMLTLMGVSPFLAGTVKGIIIIISVLVQRKG